MDDAERGYRQAKLDAMMTCDIERNALRGAPNGKLAAVAVGRVKQAITQLDPNREITDY